MERDLQRRLDEAEKKLASANSRIVELEDQLSTIHTNKQFERSEDQPLSRLAKRLAGLHRLDHAILSVNSLENLAQVAINHVVELIPCFRVTISTIDLAAKTGITLIKWSV